jgi:hypothetical protein
MGGGMWRAGLCPCPPGGALPLHPGGGSAPSTPGGALPLHPGQEKRGWAPLLSWQSLIRPLCTMRDDVSGHTLHGGPPFTRVSDCVRARRCTSVHPGRHLGSTRQRRVPALHTCAPMTANRPHWQRRVPRALVRRGGATGLGARNLWWRVGTTADGEARRTTGQPQPWRAQATPAAHSCRLAPSFSIRRPRPTGPAANRSPEGRGRRQPHTRAVWLRR